MLSPMRPLQRCSSCSFLYHAHSPPNCLCLRQDISSTARQNLKVECINFIAWQALDVTDRREHIHNFAMKFKSNKCVGILCALMRSWLYTVFMCHAWHLLVSSTYLTFLPLYHGPAALSGNPLMVKLRTISTSPSSLYLRSTMMVRARKAHITCHHCVKAIRFKATHALSLCFLRPFPSFRM
jgi:hypothetical protein